MSDIQSLASGLAQGINGYLGLQQKTQAQGALNQQESDLQTQQKSALEQQKVNLDLTHDQEMKLYQQTIEGHVDPNTAANIAPDAAKTAKDFYDQNGRYPTVDEFSKLHKPKDPLAVQYKQQQFDDQRLTQMGRQLSSDREFTQIRTKRDNLENVGALLDQVASQPEGPDKRQMYEQAMAQVRTLIGNGALSEREIEHMLPSTFAGKVGAGLEWITNHPQSVEGQQFLKRSRDFFNRETGVTTNQMYRRVTELGAPYKHVLERNPDSAKEVFSVYDVPHPIYNPTKSKNANASDDIEAKKAALRAKLGL